jgi:PEGA domain
MTALSQTVAGDLDNGNDNGNDARGSREKPAAKPRLYRGSKDSQGSESSQTSQASHSELVWPIPPEDLAKVVFDSQNPGSEIAAPAAKPRASEIATDHSAPPSRRTSTTFSWWLPALLVVTAFETTYLGIRAADDWRRRDASAGKTDVLTARLIVSPWTASLPSAAIDESTALYAEIDHTSGLALAQPGEPAIGRPGWASIDLPFQVQIYESGRFIGTNDHWRVGLSAGQHELELVNESLGYRSTASINIRPGEIVPLSITLPSGLVSLNALPWGAVLIDGESVGDTPIGNLEVPIGPHQIVFQHPELGEEARSVLISAGTVTRISVDFRK